MTREEFLALPPAIAFGILLDLSPAFEQRLATVPAPKPIRPPKFDQAIYRREGVQWASETDLEGLRYWRKRYADSADTGGEYAMKDAKRAKQMEYWITWREAFPQTQWSGERNHEQVTAYAPSARPLVHPSQPRERKQEDTPPQSQSSAPNFDDEDIKF